MENDKLFAWGAHGVATTQQTVFHEHGKQCFEMGLTLEQAIQLAPTNKTQLTRLMKVLCLHQITSIQLLSMGKQALEIRGITVFLLQLAESLGGIEQIYPNGPKLTGAPLGYKWGESGPIF